MIIIIIIIITNNRIVVVLVWWVWEQVILKMHFEAMVIIKPNEKPIKMNVLSDSIDKLLYKLYMHIAQNAETMQIYQINGEFGGIINTVDNIIIWWRFVEAHSHEGSTRQRWTATLQKCGMNIDQMIFPQLVFFTCMLAWRRHTERRVQINGSSSKWLGNTFSIRGGQ